MQYTNQAPKEFDKMSAGFKKKYRSVEQLPADRWKVQPKYDGVFAIINLAEGKAYTRQGKEMFSIQHIIDKLNSVIAHSQDCVVFGEVWHHSMTHQEINGASRRKSAQPELRFVCLDMVHIVSYGCGFEDNRYGARLAAMSHYVEREKVELGQYSTLIKPTTYHQDWVLDHQGIGCDSIQDFATALVGNKLDRHYGAYDGAMLVDMEAPWTAGAVKEGQAIKVKDKLTLDVVAVGQRVEQRDTKLGGHLTVTYNGVLSDVGSGLTQGMLRAALENGVDYTGCIVEVECLGLTPDGKLREPRFKGFRHDTVREEDKE